MAGNRGERFSYRVESYIWLRRTKVSESDPECIVSQFNCQFYMGKLIANRNFCGVVNRAESMLINKIFYKGDKNYEN